MLNLTSTSPKEFRIGVPGRIRRKFEVGYSVRSVPEDEPIEYYEGVRCQPLVEAIRTSAESVVPSRRLEAAENAFKGGYIGKRELTMLKKEIRR